MNWASITKHVPLCSTEIMSYPYDKRNAWLGNPISVKYTHGNYSLDITWVCLMITDIIKRHATGKLYIEWYFKSHYSDAIMSAMASPITSITIVYCITIVYSGTDQRKHQKLRVTGLCEGNSPMTGEFPAQRASNADNVSIWWRHHEIVIWIYLALSKPCVGKNQRGKYIQ